MRRPAIVVVLVATAIAVAAACEVFFAARMCQQAAHAAGPRWWRRTRRQRDADARLHSDWRCRHRWINWQLLRPVYMRTVLLHLAHRRLHAWRWWHCVARVILPLYLLLLSLLHLQLRHRPAQGLRLRLQRLPQLAQLAGVLALHVCSRVVRSCQRRGEQAELSPPADRFSTAAPCPQAAAAGAACPARHQTLPSGRSVALQLPATLGTRSPHCAA